VHTPIQPKPGSAAPFRDKKPDRGQKNARYAGMIATLDEGVGRIVDLLDELGLSENTLVLFISDNGGHGAVTSNLPLRGAKGMLYEGGIRIPWIVRQPGKVTAGSVNATPVITSDLLATFAALTAVPKSGVPNNDGVDLLPLFYEGKAPERRALHWHFPAYLALSGKRGTWRTTPASAIRVGKYKLLHFFEDNRHELYDLEKDPGEKSDLSATEPGLVVDLEAELARWRLETNAPIPSERNPDYGK
jgi:arylsulfatase A-like enzyme